ncbi:serine protease [Clostridium botulinum D/C]|uniref:S1 family peptidase n=1 Tax=Clostridium botulinum TaxID=1491 RepID=UPI001E497CB1|nr:S1 family peptidase [Clostridium botulinum]MCD3349455.1 serine protease [Clostridium botulinum D/C]MCD3358554.1 serine protease [Clostridium botulinum D/C]MCD3364359.1 serine protease [Clostridium botulinum D/C]
MICNYCIDNMISYICYNEYNFFFSKGNVVGVGLGYKIKNGFHTREKCITVFVTRKLPPNDIPEQDLVPAIYRGIPTDIVQSGIMSIDSNILYNNFNLNNPLTKKIRPVLGGYSIGVATKKLAGTMGCLVTDNHDNYMLSNNHILAGVNTIPLGTAVVQPSIVDGGKSPKDIVGSLSVYIPLSFKDTNLVDCAIAKVLNKKNVSAKIALTKGPKGVITPKFGQSVKKVGRTTALTTGKIVGVKTTYKVEIEGIEMVFRNQIIADIVVEPGDSGSILLSDNDYAIGLVMTGGGGKSIINTISDVLKSLNVLLVTA